SAVRVTLPKSPSISSCASGRTGHAEHLPRHARGGPTWATLASVLALATSLLPIGVRGWVAPVAGLVGGGRWGWGRLGATLIERLRRNGFAAPRVAVAPRRSSPQHAAPRRPPVRTMSNVDLGRFAGDWCEIAHFAARVNAACGGAVTSRYQPRGPALAVTRRCVNRRGREIRVHGEARPVAGSAGARLRVTFAPAWLRGMAWIWVDHCILFVDADYQYALVGTPDRAALWLLARTPTLQRSALVELVECAQAQGFDIDRLRRTPPSA
ncbi:MAG: lipocalin family protein, partial [Burkholderiaceae bacterium]